jgi:hypothetical protein
MGKYVERQTPRSMPDIPAVRAATANLATPFLVVGSRGVERARNKRPDPEIHTKYAFVQGGPALFAGSHLFVFTHGYNVTTQDALKSAREFFSFLAPSLKSKKVPLAKVKLLLFTWPGDVGPIHFNVAQQYAQLSGVALYELLKDIHAAGAPTTLNLVSHSLGAHVVLRALAVLGERNFRKKTDLRVDRTLLLAAAVEDDVFRRPDRGDEYHFPEAAFGTRHLHIGVSRSDEVLAGAFRVNEADMALGYRGPESMSPLASLMQRVPQVLGGGERFTFEQHDFSPTSSTILNPDLQVRGHGDYWRTMAQTDYYATLLTAATRTT